MLSNVLTVKQDLPWFHVDLKLSYGRSENLDPRALSFTFQQRQALVRPADYLYLDPQVTMRALTLDPSRAGYSGLSHEGDRNAGAASGGLHRSPARIHDHRWDQRIDQDRRHDPAARAQL